MARTLTRPMFRKGGMARREEYMGGGIKTIRPKYMGGGMTGIMSGIVPDAGLTPRTGFQEGGGFLQSVYDFFNPSAKTIVDRLQKVQESQSEPIIKTVGYQEEERKKLEEEKALREQLDKTSTNVPGTPIVPKPSAGTPKKTSLDDVPSDKETVKDYVDMFKSALGNEEDSEKRNKYLALAQFGANLLSQPGGDLVGAVGKASTPAIQTLGKAMSDKRDAERQAKLLGTQAYLKSIEPGALRKQIDDLMALGYTKQGAITKIVDEGRGTATRESTQVTKRENLSEELTEEGIPPRQAGVVAGKILASKVPDYNYSLLPDDPVEGEYYYDKKGNVGKYVIKNGVAGLDDGKE